MEESSLTSYDNAILTASFYYYYEDHFNCDKKRQRLVARIGEEKADVMMRSENGCGVISDKVKYEIDGIKYHSCMCTYRTPEVAFYLNVLDKLDKGILPFQGSFVDQPSKIVEYLDRLSHMKTELMIRQQKQRENK